ncbi:MAG: threonine synthase [Gammaproteobacteria bacterium]|jgi:threonine synthase|nr:threonine synthase [Gammaproteobacteria bacterium]MBT4462792.1 threonine synthase [Gammaproteobacteria bacterium]MBT4654332.1 threonine synthase [Gammaproteobacteria bacterium]MBT5117348.1 threonine synthase [Gammaproteobacteria bacterium]MBT5761919.1 threonine synthase [Gammaproteobacteria bacterium]
MINSLKYISTRGSAPELSFKDVIFEGLASDGGLYVPKHWPCLSNELIDSFSSMTYQEIAYEVISPYIDSTLSDEDLKAIIKKSYSCFDNTEITPLTKLDNKNYLLELYHGPTYAFKDVAMQFISQLMNFYLNENKQSINILGATSGDTGAAAIEGFKNVKSAKIFILHPYNKISEVQRKFMTTIKSENVFNIAIKGSFDDCQNIIKKIFSDNDYKKEKSLTAINSINWSRIMCQMVYYFYTLSRIKSKDKKVLFSVPTGNFGDILAGYISKKMGLKIDMLNIATNDNDILTRTLMTGRHQLQGVIETTSPSIDIQISSNFERLLYDITQDSNYVSNLMNELKRTGKYTLKENDLITMRKSFCSYSVSEEESANIIKNTFEKYKVIIDPHTAVGLSSAQKCDKEYDIMITLSTAHPAKFKDTVSNLLHNEEFITKKVSNILKLDENMTILDNDIDVVRNFITGNI